MARQSRGRLRLGRMFSPRLRRASAVASIEAREKRRKTRVKKWRERFKRFSLSAWHESAIVQSVVGLFRASAETARTLRAATGSQLVGAGVGNRVLRVEGLEARQMLSTTPWNLDTQGNFSQDWSNTGLISANDDWSNVPSIVGYRGDDVITTIGTDPQTALAFAGPVNSPVAVIDVIANQTNASGNTTGGILEYHSMSFSDDFESYANQAAFEAVWTPIGTVAPTSAEFSTAQAASATHSIRVPGTGTNSQSRNRATFTETGVIAPGDQLVFSFDFYDGAPTASPQRNYANLQDTTGPSGTNQLVAMGFNNNQTGANSGGQYYMARILGYTVPTTADPDGGATESVGGAGAFFKLNDFGAGARSLGWHNLKVVMTTDDGLSTDYAFYVDNVLAERVSNVGTAASIRSYDNIALGSGVSNGSTEAFFDNMNVQFIPAVAVNPVVALQGSGTADAPFLNLYMNSAGRDNVTISYNLRDIDGSGDNSVQPVALQYRIGGTGDYINVPTGFVADASTGPNLATAVTPVSVSLPQWGNVPDLQFRIITTNASGNDEWIGIDDITVTSTQILYVDDDWTGFSSGQAITDADASTLGNQGATFGTDAFATIQDALNAAAPNRTVIVNSGTYSPGTIDILDGKTLKIVGAVDVGNADISVAPGNLIVDGSLTTTGNIAVASGGKLGGVGSISTGTVFINNGAMLAAGDSPGTLSITGNVNFNAGSTFAVELNGTAANQHDLLAVTGNVNINATSTLALTVGYPPVAADTIQILSHTGTRTGTFAYSLTSGFRTTYNANDLSVFANSPPTFITGGSQSTAENSTVVATLDAGDVDLDSVSFTITGGTDQAHFQITGGNQLEFISAPNFELPTDANTDRVYLVEVTASDGIGGTAVLSLQVTVTDVNEFAVTQPVDSDAAADEVNEGVPQGTYVGITASATDADGSNNTVTYSLFDNDGGRFDITAGGAVVTGSTVVDRETDGASRTITVRATSSDGSTMDQMFLISILPVNESTPAANDDAIAVNEGGSTASLSPSGSSILANDTDADLPGDTLTVALVNGSAANVGVPTPTAHGTVTVNADGTFSYQHDGSETTSDSFTYAASDGTFTSAAATVTITISPVNDETPVANDDAMALNEGGSAASLSPSGSSVLGNDTDADLPGDTLTVALVNGSAANVGVPTPTAHGTVTVNADGTFSYQHDGSETTSDSFTYAASDGTFTSAAATVTITISPVNDETPVAINDGGDVFEDGVGVATGNVLGNDTDADLPADTLNVDPSDVGTGITGVYGSLDLAADGSYTYTLNQAAVQSLAAGQTITDDFTYKATDGTHVSLPATLSITIHGTNDVPSLGGDTAGDVSEDGTLVDSGALTISDADAGQNSFQAAGGATTYGSYTLDSAGNWAYTLDNSNIFVQGLDTGDTLSDSFTALAADGTPIQVNITINGLDEPPGVVIINGDNNNNSLVIDLDAGTYTLDGGAPQSLAGIGDLTFNGGAGLDSITITGGTFGTVTYDYTNATEGDIDLGNGLVVHYTGLDPITNDGTTSNAVFNLPASGDNASLSNSGGNVTLVSSPITFETTTISAPTSSLTVNANDGDDTLTVQPDNGYAVTVTGGSHVGGDTLSVDAAGAYAINTGSEIRVQGFANIAYSAFEIVTLLNAAAAPTTLYVDDSWVGTLAGADPDGLGAAINFGVDSFATIQDAINSAVSGAIIYVHAGTYNEALSIDKSLSINEIDGIGTADVDAGLAFNGVDLAPTSGSINVSISGLDFSNASANGIHVGKSGANLANLTLSNSSVSGGLTGVWVDGGTLDMDSTIIQNVAVFGVQVGNGGLADIETSEISGTATTAAGVIVSSGNASIESSILSNSNRGLLVNATGTATVHGSKFENNSIAAIVNGTSTTVNASGNAWNTNSDAAIAGLVTGPVDFTPYLDSSVDQDGGARGFLGDFSHVHVTTLGDQAGMTGRVQEGVDEVDAGGLVDVHAGTYVDNVTINKSLHLVGLDATAGDGSGDVIIQTGADDADILYITGNNVEIEKLTLEGINGADQAYGGIRTSDTAEVTGIDIHDNLIRNVNNRGIKVGYNFSTTPSTVSVTDNVIQNMTDSGDGFGIAAFHSTGTISGNSVTSTFVGIITNTSAGVLISGNDIHDADYGIYLANSGGAVGPADEVAGNTIDTGASATSVGIEVFNAGKNVSVHDNVISDVNVGMNVYSALAAPVGDLVTIADNQISDFVGLASVGLFISSDDFGGNPGAVNLKASASGNTITGADTGIWVQGAGGRTVEVAITGDNEITGSNIGILVEEISGSVALVTIDGNEDSIHGNAIGINVNGGSATITNNHIYDNTVGIKFENGGSGTVGGLVGEGNDFNDDTAGDSDDDNVTDILVDATAGAVTIGGDNQFAGDNFFIDNQSAQDISALGNTFDVADDFRVEDKMFHKVDDLSKGRITWVAGSVFVTAPGVGSTDSEIQRGIYAASAGDTLFIEAGTYSGAGNRNLDVDKKLTIDGDTTGTTIIDADGFNGFDINASGAGTSDRLVIKDLTVTDASSTGSAAFLIDGVSSFVTLDGVAVSGSYYGFFADDTSDVEDLDILNSSFTTSFIGLYNEADTSISNNQDFFNDVLLQNVAVSGNSSKGIYFERANNLTLDNVDLTHAAADNGLDLNLKHGDFTNVQITNGSSFTNTGAGTAAHIKGRNDVYGAGTDLAGLSINNSTFTSTTLPASGLSIGNAVSGISFSNADFTGTGNGILLYVTTPQALDLGDSDFASSLGAYVANGTPFAVDGTDGTYGGVLGSSATPSQGFAITDKILDGVDVPGLGLVRIRDNQVFVTPNSFYVPLGTSSPDVQRGVNAASTGDTVFIEAGSYTGNVNTSGKALTIELGDGAAQVTVNGNVTLDGDDTLHMELNGLVAGTQHDQLVVNGGVDLGSATLDLSGSTLSAANGQSVGLIDNDMAEGVSNTFGSLPNGSIVTIGAESYILFYNGGTGNDVTLTRVPNAPPANVVFVDDGWIGTSNGTDADGAGGGSLGNGSAFGYDQFATIQDAINSVASGGTIWVYAGNYIEQLNVTQAVSLKSANTGIAGSGSRSAEAVITAGAAVGALIEVSAAGVTIDGFTVDGDDLAVRAIRVNEVDNAVVANNIITASVRGVQYNGAAAGNAGGAVTGNLIQNLTTGAGDSYGVLAFDSSYASVTNNVMTGLDVGIFEQYFYQPNGGANSTNVISGNTITAALLGYGTNERSAAAATTALSGNVYTIGAGGVGVQLYNIYKPGGITLTGESISGAQTGVYAYVNGGSVSIANSSITGTSAPGSIGVHVTNHLVDFASYATAFSNVASSLTISGSNISGVDSGVVVEDANADWAGDVDSIDDATGAVNVQIDSDTNIFNTDTAVHVSGPMANAIVTGNDNSIHDNSVGVDVDGGTATVTGNHFYANGTAVWFHNGGTGSVGGNDFDGGASADNATDLLIENNGVAIGANNEFAGDTFFIDNLSTTDYDLSANGTTFDETSNYRIEDKIHHEVDTDLSLGNGLVTWVAGNLYITSGGTDHSIQRGVDVATAGDTINVEAGTYTENVNIDKSLTLLSDAGRAATTIQGISGAGALGTIVIANGVNNVQIGGLAGSGFTVIGIDNGNPGIENAAVYLQGAHSGIGVRHNDIVANGDAGLMTEFGQANTNFVIDNNIFSGQTFVGPSPADNGFANQFTTPNVPRQLVVMGSGSGTTSTANIAFTNNTITGTAGGSNGGGEQGNTLVTIDALGTNISGNAFSGVSTRFANSLRARGANNTITGNLFNSTGMGANTVDIYVNRGGNVIQGNTFTSSAGGAVQVDGALGAATIGGTALGESNSFTSYDAGVIVSGGTAAINSNTFTSNGIGVAAAGNATIVGNNFNSSVASVDVNGGSALIQGNVFAGSIGVRTQNGGIADLGQTSPSASNFTGQSGGTGPNGASAGGNDFSSYTTAATSAAGAVVNLNTNGANANPGRQGAPPDVTAFGNTWAVATPVGIENVVWHDSDSSTLGFVDFAAFGNLVVTATTPTTINEGGSVSIDGSFSNVPQAHTITINWGDGSPNTVINNSAGDFDFSASHVYADDVDGPPNSSTHNIVVTVQDAALATVDNSGSPIVVTVNNLAPVVTFGSAPTSAGAGQTKHYTFTTADAGDDNHTPGELGPENITVTSLSGGAAGVVSNIVFDPVTGNGSFDVTFNVPPGSGSVEVKVQVPDDDGLVGESSVVVTVGNTLRVTNFALNASGFDVTFNRAIDLNDLNLYDYVNPLVVGDTFRTPDVVVHASIANIDVTGTVVWNGATNTLSWVKTGGPLASDNYTLTLRSGSDAFRDLFGNLLDGNSDFVGGDNYVQNFNVTVVGGTPIVSIPDFARGPGQGVDLTANNSLDVSLPVRATGVNVQGVNFKLVYDTTLLTINPLAVTPALPNWGISVNQTMSGTIATLSVAAFANLPSAAFTGTFNVVNIVALVPTSAAYGASQVLRLSNSEVNDDDALNDFTIQKVVFPGDSNGSGILPASSPPSAYTAFDASLIAQVVVGMNGSTGFDATPLVDPAIVGDASGNGGLNAFDASLIGQESAGINTPEVPDETAPGSGGFAAFDPELSIPDNLPVTTGHNVVVPVNITIEPTVVGIISTTYTVQYDTATLDFTGASQSANFPSPSWTFNATETSPGTIQVSMFSSSPSTNNGGLPQELSTLNFYVLNAATLGTSGLSIAPVDPNESGLVWTNDNGSVNISRLLGDYDFNGVVDSSDYVIWRRNVGMTVPAYTSADGNGDGTVDAADYGVWRAHFGETIPGAGSGSLALGGMASAYDLQPAAATIATVSQPLESSFVMASASPAIVESSAAHDEAITGLIESFGASERFTKLPASRVVKTGLVAQPADRDASDLLFDLAAEVDPADRLYSDDGLACEQNDDDLEAVDELFADFEPVFTAL